MRVWGLALGLVGCGFSSTPNNGPSDGAVVPDGGADAAVALDAGLDGAVIDGKPEPVCVGTFVRVCIDPPQAALTLSTQRIDTATSSRCIPYTAMPVIDACVIAGAQITIPAGNAVTAVGRRPLILVSTRGIVVEGTLDVSSRGGSNAQTGAAADTGPCATDFMNPPVNGSGGGR
ncbi:MAG: hypothetical protein H7138_20375 [Myxococcales bacterium]|nr:hypothetical protein [Myxococcales bacterium]